jgi:hypothetical protein
MAMQSFRRGPRRREAGQVMVFVVLGLGLFLLGAMAFAIDLSNLWFNRQAAQTAADAACTAGAMDMMVNQVNGSTIGGFTPPTQVDCTPTSTAAPCEYAALNGFNSSILQSAANSGTIGNNVYVDFPTAANAPPGITAPSATLAPNPFIRVAVTNNIQSWFAGMLGQTSQRIQGIAVCGLQADIAPIPIIVLHPNLPSSFSVQGSPAVNIIGGSTQSIQVNSCSSLNGSTSPCGANDPANFGGSATVNLCAAGQNFCGANMGVFGKEANPGGSSFITSCSGNRPTGAPICNNGNPLQAGTQLTPKFNSPQSPIGDPFASTAAPTNPDTGLPTSRATPFVPTDLCGPNLKRADGVTVCGQINSVGSSGTGTCTSSDIETGQCLIDYKFHGCPDPNAKALGVTPTTNNSCILRSPGYYSQGIQVKNGVTVFDPGLYYLDPITSGSDKDYELALDSNSYVRPSFYSGGYYTFDPTTGKYVAATVPSWYQYGDGGTLFYFNFPSGSGCIPKCSVHVDSNSGKNTGAPDTFGTNSYLQAGATAQTMTTCPNGGAAPSVTVPDIIGNVLLAPCSLNGTWSNPSSGSGPSTTYAQYRGMLFFEDRGNSGTTGNNKQVTADWGGGGQFLLAGTMYFHQCKVTTTGTDVGTGCAANTPVPFNDIFQLSGGSSSGTYVLGEIITDQLQLGGNSAINMQLDPNPASNVLKVALLQ